MVISLIITKRSPRSRVRRPTTTERVARHEDVARGFLPRILGIEFDQCFISDESNLCDFHCEDSNEACFQRIQQVYGVDVSDIESGNLAEIFERIKANQGAA